MSPEMLIAMISAKALSFGDMARGGRPQWTAQDAATACAGLPSRIYGALCFTYAGDESKYWLLLSELQEWAGRAAWREMRARNAVDNPPPRIWTDDACAAVETLAEMWLLEVKEPWRFARKENMPVPDLHRIIVAVDQKTWQRRLSPAYEAIGSEFYTWLDIGTGRMRSRLRDPSAAEFAALHSEKIDAQEQAKLSAAAKRWDQAMLVKARLAKRAKAKAYKWAVDRTVDERGHLVYRSRKPSVCARD